MKKNLILNKNNCYLNYTQSNLSSIKVTLFCHSCSRHFSSSTNGQVPQFGISTIKGNVYEKCGDEEIAMASIDGDRHAAMPMCWVKSVGSEGNIDMCSICGCLLSGARHHLAREVGLEENAELFSEALDIHPEVSLHGVECALGCGLRFCGEKCWEAAVASGHKEVCVGPHSEDHPLYVFKMLALDSGEYDLFVLAAQLFVLCQKNTDESLLGKIREMCPWQEMPLGVHLQYDNDGDEKEEEGTSVAVAEKVKQRES